jgi:hypothetical protein
MRTLSKLALAALLIGFVAPAFAQGAGNTSITVEQPWSRATPTVQELQLRVSKRSDRRASFRFSGHERMA